MKRSLFDPLPRQISTQALAALVAVVVCGTGVAVARFLESSPGPVARPSSIQAASPSEGPRAPRASRPGTWGAAPAAGASIRADTCSTEVQGQRADPSPCQGTVRDCEPTQFRPAADGA